MSCSAAGSDGHDGPSDGQVDLGKGSPRASAAGSAGGHGKIQHAAAQVGPGPGAGGEQQRAQRPARLAHDPNAANSPVATTRAKAVQA